MCSFGCGTDRLRRGGIPMLLLLSGCLGILDADDGGGQGRKDEEVDPYGVDSDDDGLSDGDEADMGLDPENADSDDDGLSDGDEVEMGADPTAEDSDGDGYSDGDEVEGNTDPTDEESHPYAGGWRIGDC